MYAKLVLFCVTITLAFLWRNYWALVAGIISSQLALNISSYVMHPYRPRFSLAKVGEIGAFSGWTLFRTDRHLHEFTDRSGRRRRRIRRQHHGPLFGRRRSRLEPAGRVNGPMVAVLYPVMSAFSATHRIRALY